MIALDNTPAHGDYVRYIDDLMKRAALAAPAVVSSDGDMASDVNAMLRERSNAASSSGIGDAGNEWTPTASSVRRMRPSATPSSGFTGPVVASPAAAAASAALANAASALMSGQVGRGGALSARAWIGLAAIVVAVVLIVSGLLVQPFNLAFVVGGAALIAWVVRGMKAVGRRRPTKSA